MRNCFALLLSLCCFLLLVTSQDAPSLTSPEASIASTPTSTPTSATPIASTSLSSPSPSCSGPSDSARSVAESWPKPKNVKPWYRARSKFKASDSLQNAADESDVIVLTDEDFEQRTQAATGATTGDWFVEYYASWCGFCKRLIPAWAKLATSLRGQIMVAKIEATLNPRTALRFHIKGYPTLIFLHNGKMYEYKGERSLKDMKKFAISGWKSNEGTDVPKPLSFMSYLWEFSIEVWSGLGILWKEQPGYTCLMFLGGILLGLVISYILLRCLGLTNTIPVATHVATPVNASTSTNTENSKKKK